jgi:acyl-CoA thioester hydrolase
MELPSETFEDKLLLTYRGTIYPWHCDHVGHMNVMWYVGKFDEATWNFFIQLGLTPSFLRQNNRGMAAVKQEIEYKHELRAGDVITIRSGLLEIKQKKNEETDEIAAITVWTGVYMDTAARKSCPFPDEIRIRASKMIVKENPKNT